MREWTMPTVEELEVQETKGGTGGKGPEDENRTPVS